MDNSKIGNRNTSIELLRLLCMVFIVAYHAMLKSPMWGEAKYRAVSLVFHVGVPVFILISDPVPAQVAVPFCGNGGLLHPFAVWLELVFGRS